MKKKYQLINSFFKKNPKRLVIAIVLVVIAVVVIRYVGQKKQQPQIQTQKVERGMIISSISASGQVLNSNMMDVATQASGVVKKVYIKNGDFVKKGDKIAEISLDRQGQQKNAQSYSSYLSAKNTMESAKVTQYSLQSDMFGKWDTFKELAEGDEYKDETSDNRNIPEFHMPEKDWLAAEGKYKNQQAVINQTQAAINSAWLSYQLSSPIVTAPIDGAVVGLAVAEGMIVSSSGGSNESTSQRIAVVKNEGNPIAFFNLSEIDVSRVFPEQKATIMLDSFPEKTFTGQVVSVDKVGSTTSGVTQYPALILFDTSASEILSNMAATAKIILDKKDNALLVLSSVVQVENDQNFVKVMKNGQSQSVMVEIGIVSDTQTEIVSGLNEGDLVILNNLTSTDQQGSSFSPFGGGTGRMMIPPPLKI